MADIEKQEKLQEVLDRVRNELNLLYEISNAMRTTLKLDEILYIILTAVTAHAGLGFNRAMLFLVNEKDNILEGKMGIGPDTGEEANRIWRSIETQKMTLDDLINNYKNTAQLSHSQLNRFVQSLGVSLEEKEEDGSVLAITLSDGIPLHIKLKDIPPFKQDKLISALKPEEFVTVPLKAKNKIIGVLFADNPYTHKPITNDDVRVLTMFANQAGLAIENSQLYEQTLIRSHTDSLTGLWNHGYFQYRLQEEINTSKVNRWHLSIIMVDLDNFKIYNDTFGHQEGDKILKEVAKVFNISARKQDSIYRYGGEEFVILLLHTNKTEACIIAERIRLAVEKHEFPYEEILPNKKLTISLGVATFPDDADTKDLLLQYADKTLYSAKHQGKNRICG
jgi:diguanylate cyclase (GGDEF)-like protein